MSVTGSTGETHADEIRRGERFTFGANWAAFLQTLDETRIDEAVRSLRDMLDVDRLDGTTFLDIGSGSGLFSLAARRLGAEVTSFDYDPQSVGCTQELQRRYFPGDPGWRVEQGSVLDRQYVESHPMADVVYSWGVLHHTGKMWEALENAGGRVKPGGQLFIALYNDEGWKSRFWLGVKKVYCSGTAGQWLMKLAFVPQFAAIAVAKSIITRTNQFAAYKRRRGMSMYHDWIDWLGGLPFEVAKPEEILDFYRKRGFTLENLRTTNRMGCNQFVFRRIVGVQPSGCSIAD
jgi:2-polyprenyl-6-hydroxyphenyl methylase/3-demethylubiquinone-9 3-methyltransferase